MRQSIVRAATALTVVLAALTVPSTAAQAAPCTVTPRSGVKSVTVHRSPTSIPPVGRLYAGQRANAGCATVPGRGYRACGGTSKLWVKIARPGLKGWVPRLCVRAPRV